LLKQSKSYRTEHDVPESTLGLLWDSTDVDKVEMEELMKVNKLKAANPVALEEYLVQVRDFSDDELKPFGIAREEILGAIENLAIIERERERASKQRAAWSEGVRPSNE
jgi:hypothetical protein